MNWEEVQASLEYEIYMEYKEKEKESVIPHVTLNGEPITQDDLNKLDY